MGHLSSGCHSCGKDCINVEFCSEGASFSSEDKGIKLPKSLKVKITANPDYWGFDGVLTSGYVNFDQGHYDYFEGFDENWWGTASCEDESTQQGRNEKRPDVTFRSVYDPDTGETTHYNGSTEETASRGGAVAYLINRAPGQIGAGGTADEGTCPEVDPWDSFKRFPENFGWANKIHFDTTLYKNLTGAWRMVDYGVCYDADKIVSYESAAQLDGDASANYGPHAGHLITCVTDENGVVYKDTPKQNLLPGSNHYKKYYDPARVTVTGLNALDTLKYNEIDSEYGQQCTPRECLPDGSVATEYAGEMAHQMDSGSGVLGGFYRPSGSEQNLQLYIVYRDWSNNGQLTSASGLRAGSTLLVKNTVDTSYDGFYTIAKAVNFPSTASIPYNYTIVDLAGTYASGYVQVDISGSQGSWAAMGTHDPNTCCGLNALGVDDRFKDIHCETAYHSDFRRVFNDPKFIIQSNRSPANRETYDYGTVTPYVTGAREDKDYIGTTASGFPSGTRTTISEGVTGYTPYFPRKLPYYGIFYDTDLVDNVTRGESKLNTTKARNATCYTKKSTLDVYPDCLTQYIKYHVCGTSPAEYKYKINRVPRLSFVYRGCDFHDSCTFDESGRPYKDPTSIDDLRRGLGGEEIHMFINLGEAWASTIKKCECDDGGYEEGSIYHVGVDSPITFPSFPDFDLEPSKYGCDDETFQLANYLKYVIGSDDAGSSPDAGQLPQGFCDTVPKLAESCNVRQPYTTYGYMMNLCGKQGRQRRKILEAFNTVHQSGTYNHLTPGTDIDEPMYRAFTVPSPAPYSSGDAWQTTGVLDEDYIVEKIGERVGFWGLRDVNGALVAPYYKTESGVFTCPGGSTPDVQGFINFSDSGNYIHGWPTSDVPFLIQLEAETRCVGCTTSMMETGNLTLNIESLTTDFLHQISHDSATASTLIGGMYGYQHCNYGNYSLDATDTFHCSSGFQENYCLGNYTGYNSIETISQQSADGDAYFKTYGPVHSGGTCPSMSGLSITLSGYNVGTSQYPKGWQTGSTSQPYVKIFTNPDSNFINEQPAGYRLKADGYSLYAKFGLGCRDMNVGGEGSQIDLTMPLRMETAYMDIASADAVRVLFGGQGCPGHYPTRLSNNRSAVSSDVDLSLYARFWAIAPEYETLFESLDPTKWRKHAETSDDLWDGGRIQTVVDTDGLSPYNIFGLCQGDRVYIHGCFLESGAFGTKQGSNAGTYSVKEKTGFFFGVSGAECTGTTICNTCDKRDWAGSDPSVTEGEVVCDPECAGGTEGGFIGYAVGYNEIQYNVKPPLNYEFNNCFCKCEDPAAFAYYEVTGTSGEVGSAQSMFDGLNPAHPGRYWYSITRASTNNSGVNGCSPSNTGQATNPTEAAACNSLGPFMINTGPPNHPNIAYSLGFVSPEDWFSYSHGVNKEVTGIQHDLVPPRLVTNTTSPGEGCNTLTVKTCETGYDQFGMTHAGCSVDPTNRVNSANCKDPIYHAGWNSEKVKTNATVRKKACFPETMIVNKIECNTSTFGYQYYDLLVSREFISHDRTWKRVRDIGGSNACAKQLVGAYFYPAGDPDTGDPNACTGCTPIPYAVPSDLVTPVYEAPCSVHPSSGAHVNQDFTYNVVTAANSGAIEIRCDGACWYTYLGSWNFNASKSTCACSCSPPAGGGSMGEERLGTCS